MVLLVLLGASCALPARAALTWQPQGSELQVNSYTVSDQLHPAVASDAAGNFVVLWLDKVRGLFIRRFNASGAPLTGEIRVDDPPIPATWLARQDLPRIAMDGRNGNFAVIYSSADGIWFRRFNAIAQLLDRIGLPYNSAGELLLEPDAAYDGAGNFLVVWRATVPGRTFILLQHFDDQARAVGGASPVNEVIAGLRSRRRLALDPGSGDILATWVDESQAGNPNIWARRLDAAGHPRAHEFQVDVDNNGNGEAQSALPLAHGDGGFSIVWSNFLPASPIGPTVEVRAQRFDALGTRLGPDTLVTGEGTDTNPVATVVDSHGNVLVLWPGADLHSADVAVFGRLFDPFWQPLTDRFQVNARSHGDQTQPAVTAGSQGRFVALWAGAEVDFTDPRTGGAGRGQAHGLTEDTGAFWFFAAANLELMVKVLDGRTVNGKFWVFFGALSDVDYTLTVTDTQTGQQKTYHNPQGTLASRADIAAF
ncbi:MAG: hypothetical protein WAM82_10435 [Thermoanaerobaculia bacterium]